MYIKEHISSLFNELEKNVGSYLINYDQDILSKAFEYAYFHHDNQFRANGEEYIIHLVNTANILAGLSTDFPSIITGILHDIIRDTEINYWDLEEKFGKEIADLVQNVTKVSELPSQEEVTNTDLEFLKKVFRIAGKDIRIILIKICERIDFINTLSYLDEDIQKQKAKETLDIYVPLIKIFGIGKYIGNVEDICFSYIEPAQYKRLEKILSKQEGDFQEKIIVFKEVISEGLRNKDIECKVEGRIKTLYSINKKLKSKHIPLSGVYDLIALRIIVDNKEDTYMTLGVIHSLFKSKQDRIKDYISSPKANGYQSIHTTVSDEDGFVFEIQIQTNQMYQYNMFGLASHVSYKGLPTNTELYPSRMKKLLYQQKGLSFGENFLDNISLNALKKTLICTTPKGREIELPKKSTILDFAFKVHSDIGKKAIGAWVNGEYVDNLVYTLNDGDEVELELGKEETNYPVRYLSFLKTSIARKNLKTDFKNKSENKRILLGKHLLNEQMELIGYKPFESMPRLIQKDVFNNFFLEDEIGLYLLLGSGNLDVEQIINYIYNLQQDDIKYKSKVSLNILFKKKNHKNIHSLFDVFHELNVQVIKFQYKGISSHVDIHVPNLGHLHELLVELSRIPNVSSVSRCFTGKILLFIFTVIFISIFIVSSPFILIIIEKYFALGPTVYKIMFYTSIIIFVFLLYFFKSVAKATLPGLVKQNVFWFGMFTLNTFILGTVTWEAIYKFNNQNTVFFFGLTLLLYGLTFFEYLDGKEEKTEK